MDVTRAVIMTTLLPLVRHLQGRNDCLPDRWLLTSKGLVSSADLKTRRDGFRLGKVRKPPAGFLRVSSRPSRLCHTCAYKSICQETSEEQTYSSFDLMARTTLLNRCRDATEDNDSRRRRGALTVLVILSAQAVVERVATHFKVRSACTTRF